MTKQLRALIAKAEQDVREAESRCLLALAGNKGHGDYLEACDKYEEAQTKLFKVRSLVLRNRKGQ